MAALLGCSDDDSDPVDPGDGTSDATVSVTNNSFTPTSVTVPLNGTVAWQWNSGGVAHNVTFEDEATSEDRTSGTFERTFAVAGSYPYVCTIHVAQGMAGTVEVTATSGGSTGGNGTGGGAGGGGYGS
jgi:plastocyanin